MRKNLRRGQGGGRGSAMPFQWLPSSNPSTFDGPARSRRDSDEGMLSGFWEARKGQISFFGTKANFRTLPMEVVLCPFSFVACFDL